ncbi:Bifunctional NAD(P)H-hydrate repair enzyme Nnr [Allorhodopirellula solitaria]|uniref:NAD(P)H-hydrate epimerase n=2 Tax=Allorhodopirellula solitaria TaxID=2527987 RepID=A0A5C5XQC5_9BACT|nr:Bifunctional NAD(P)H-hydrate repair enzyme Nnr [Allorhodopirellula solitaria]
MAQDWPFFSVARSREVDQLAIERFGMAGIELMRNAGTACAERLLSELSESSPATMILAGAGNNGGDGYVIAEVLTEANRPVVVYSLVPTAKLSGDAEISHDAAVAAGVSVEHVGEDEIVARISRHRGMIVDGLLGTGAQGPPRSPFAEAIAAANQNSEVRRVAIDVPSGFNGDTGEPADPTFQADLTLTFVAPKTGMMGADASLSTGEIEIVDIGLPLDLKRQLGIPG